MQKSVGQKVGKQDVNISFQKLFFQNISFINKLQFIVKEKATISKIESQLWQAKKVSN